MKTSTRDLLMGRRQPDPALQGIFTPAATDGARPNVAATFLEGRSGETAERLRNGVLGGFRRFGVISDAEHAAALGRAATIAPDAPMPVAGAAEGFGAVATGGGIAGAGFTGAAAPLGAYDAILQRDGIFLAQPNAAPVSATPLLLADDVAAPAATAAGAAAVADDVVAPVAAGTSAIDNAAQLAEQRLIEQFQELGRRPPDVQVATLAHAIDSGAAAGHGETAFGILTAEIASRPLDSSVAAMARALEDVRVPVPAAAVAVAEHVAPVAADAIAHAAPVITEVVERAAPVVGEAITHASAGSSLLRMGVPGAMGMREGIVDTLRLLARAGSRL